MESTISPEIPRELWESHKETIRCLYLVQRMPLRHVMECITSLNPIFAQASVNMYKKRIRQWGFDVKNHKFSTIQAAASERQQCLDTGQSFGAFELEGRKRVSEEELTRYARRKRHMIVGGELVPRSPILSSSQGSDWHSSLGFHEDHSVQWPLSLELQDIGGAESALDPSTVQDLEVLAPTTWSMIGGQCQCLRCLFKAQHVFSSTQRFVRLADMMAPDLHRHPEDFFRACDGCLSASWSAQLWTVDESGNLRKTHGKTSRTGFFIFESLFKRASELWDAANIRRASTVFNNALLALGNSLATCLPDALDSLFGVLLRHLYKQEIEYVSLMIRSILALMRLKFGPNTPIERLLAAIYAIEQDKLACVILSGLDVFSECFERLDDRLFRKALALRSRRITMDISLDRNSKIGQMTLLLDGARKHPARDAGVSAPFMLDFSWYYLMDNKDGKAKKIAEEVLRHATRKKHKDVCYGALRILARIHWNANNPTKAICTMKKALGLRGFGIDSFRIIGNDVRLLASWCRLLGHDQEAAIYSKQIDRITKEMTEMHFSREDSCRADCDSKERGIESTEVESAAGKPEGFQKEEHIDRDQAGEASKVSSATSVWQGYLTQGQRAEMTLPVPDCDSDSEMQRKRSW